MAVYTNVTRPEIEGLLAECFDVGSLTAFEGISDGIENSNFFVTTDRAEFVLTLFERVADEDVPYFMQLTAYLADNGIHCGRPIAAKDGKLHRVFNGKQSALIERLPGASIDQPNLAHATQVGAELGKFHRASVSFPQTRQNSFGIDWMNSIYAKVASRIEPGVATIASQELEAIARCQYDELPHGTVHGDLFQDNVLFDNDGISGVIDFYYACTEVLIYDLAIAVNDWCFDRHGVRRDAHAEALLSAYQTARTLTDAEIAALPAMYRRAAFRFWLS